MASVAWMVAEAHSGPWLAMVQAQRFDQASAIPCRGVARGGLGMRCLESNDWTADGCCACGYQKYGCEVWAEIYRLRSALAEAAACAGGPNSVNALYNVMQILKKALDETDEKEG